MNLRTEISPKLAPLTGERGVFAMLALDQRESLRAMVAGDGDPDAVPDQAIIDFKSAAKPILTPHATAVLLDRHFGMADTGGSGVAAGCALILAADILHQPAGQSVQSTEFDDGVTVEVIERTGAIALKLLVMWREDEPAGSRRPIVEAFLARCAEAGVAAVVEGIVVAPAGGFAPGARDAAVLAAAKELAGGADLYKAQVPGYVPGDTTAVRDLAEKLTASIDVPWVVLSNGVHKDDFADAVEQACLGGASGFLAGRAIWADTVAEVDPSAALAARSVSRLKRLRTVVDDATERAKAEDRG